MRIAYLSIADVEDIHCWSGTVHYMAKCLERAGHTIIPIRAMTTCPRLFLLKQSFYKHARHEKYLWELDPLLHQMLGRKVSQLLRSLNGIDLVLSPGRNPVLLTYLQSELPTVFWADSTFAGLLNFYPPYTGLCSDNVRDGDRLQQRLLDVSALAIFASPWAAETAKANYQVDNSKIKIVPFGANLDRSPTLEEVKLSVNERPIDQCRLLFMGTNWSNKNGQLAIDVAQQLNNSGLPTELILIGSRPPLNERLPDFVKVHGFISKSTANGRQQLADLLSRSHFLIAASRAECFGISLCEASAFAVPSLTTRVGGIGSVVKDGVNGMTFDRDAASTAFCAYIEELFRDYASYRALALSSYAEFSIRLNWSTSGQAFTELLQTLMQQ